MQINVALDNDSREQARQLRSMLYPGSTTASQIRDAYLFNVALDNFNQDPSVLAEYIAREAPNHTSQRMLTIKAESYERLRDTAATVNASIAATYRAIIAYTIDHGGEKDAGKPDPIEKIENTQKLITKVALLESQVAECNKTIAEIKEVLAHLY